MFVFNNLLAAIAKILDVVLSIFMWIVIARAILSWVSPDPYNPIVRFIHNITEGDHWDRCQIHWFPGNHVIHLDKGKYLKEILSFLRGIDFT